MFIALLAVTFAAPLGFADNASAAKKLTYDQAWAVCNAKMDKAGVYGTGLQANVRDSVGAGWMGEFGLRIRPGFLSAVPALQEQDCDGLAAAASGAAAILARAAAGRLCFRLQPLANGLEHHVKRRDHKN